MERIQDSTAARAEGLPIGQPSAWGEPRDERYHGHDAQGYERGGRVSPCH